LTDVLKETGQFAKAATKYSTDENFLFSHPREIKKRTRITRGQKSICKTIQLHLLAAFCINEVQAACCEDYAEDHGGESREPAQKLRKDCSDK